MYKYINPAFLVLPTVLKHYRIFSSDFIPYTVHIDTWNSFMHTVTNSNFYVQYTKLTKHYDVDGEPNNGLHYIIIQ